MVVVSEKKKQTTLAYFRHKLNYTSFFMEHNLYLKEQLTDKLWLFSLWYFVDIFVKNEWSELSLQGKQLTVLIANIKFELSSQNLNFTKVVSTTVSLTGS
jgi:DUF1365 family protein